MTLSYLSRIFDRKIINTIFVDYFYVEEIWGREVGGDIMTHTKKKAFKDTITLVLSSSRYRQHVNLEAGLGGSG